MAKTKHFGVYKESDGRVFYILDKEGSRHDESFVVVIRPNGEKRVGIFFHSQIYVAAPSAELDKEQISELIEILKEAMEDEDKG